MSQPPLPRSYGGQAYVATPSQTVGPFFHFGIAQDDRLGTLASDAAGEPLQLRIRVLDGAGAPVPDALIEIYQADASGAYGTPAFNGFGRLATDADGSCTFDTIRPGGGYINVCLFARGLLRHLYTRVYFAGDSALDTDPILALVPADRRPTLLAQKAPDRRQTGVRPGSDRGQTGVRPGSDPALATFWKWELRLQGDGETVFFDL